MEKKNRGRWVDVIVDERRALSLPEEIITREGLVVGQELGEGRLKALESLGRYQRCLARALRLLGYRARSEAEIRQRLLKYGFDGATVSGVLDELRAKGLVDDLAFARLWRENREAFRPCSRRRTVLELRRKGLSEDIIEEVTVGIDENASAYQAALAKARRLPRDDYRLFRRRLEAHLRARGFGYELIDEVVSRIWEELSGGA